jgi:hypothetical protein
MQVPTRVAIFREKYSVENEAEGNFDSFYRNSVCLFRGTENARNTGPSHSAENKKARNSVPKHFVEKKKTLGTS